MPLLDQPVAMFLFLFSLFTLDNLQKDTERFKFCPKGVFSGLLWDGSMKESCFLGVGESDRSLCLVEQVVDCIRQCPLQQVGAK